MKKHKALKIELEMVLPNDLRTEDVLQQIQEFLLDNIPIDDSYLEWEPFDVGAITISLLEDHPNAYLEQDEEDKPPLPVRKLDSATA
jgi:hypothetical protein